MAAPLILGGHVSNLTAYDLETYTNHEVSTAPAVTPGSVAMVNPVYSCQTVRERNQPRQ